MVVKAATPLAALLFIAFVLLLLSTISTPVVKAIPLASFNGIDYGVFGFCQGTKCSGIKVGYTQSNTQSTTTSFTLSPSTRSTLSAILIVHPVAAFLTLLCFVLAVASHFHGPNKSTRYHLGLVILLLPTLLITLLAFLIDILLFIPHLAWGGWIVLAATILILISGIMTCALRRTLVSRKARQKRIAENAEMNGDNYYGRQETLKADSPPPLHQQPTTPIVSEAPGADSLPSFATFDQKQPGRASEDDRIPLNSRTPSAPSMASGMRSTDDGMDRYGGPGRGGMGGMRGGRGGRYNGPRDEFGNPLPPSPAFGPGPGARENSGDQAMRHQYSNETMDSQGSRSRGRGGYGRGGPFGGPRGGPYRGRGGPSMNGNGRGGIPMGALATGASAGFVAGEMMDHDRRGPPPGYNGYGPPMRGGMNYNSRNESPAGYGQSGAYPRRQSPGRVPVPAYGLNPAPGTYGYGSRELSPGSINGQRYRRESPPPALPLQSNDGPGIGQAVEMDASTGSPSQTPGFQPGHPLRESDSDVQGLVGLQQNRIGSPLRDTPMSPTSQYSQAGEYIPPRAAWAGGIGRNGTPPLNQAPSGHSPVELSARHSPPEIQTQAYAHSPAHARMNSADNYYEDVDPRFAEPTAEPPASIPALLMPGRADEGPPSEGIGMHYAPQSQQPHNLGVAQGHGKYLEPSSSYESFEGSRSPAESDITSISRRGVNPDWRPGPGPGQGGPGYGQPIQGGYGGGSTPNRKPMGQPPRADVLAGNPDFEIGPRQGTGVARRGLM